MNQNYVHRQVFVEKQETNVLGVVGFTLAILSYITCGILSIPAAVVCYCGMTSEKPNRGLAIAGFVLSIIPLLLVLAWVVFLGLTGAALTSAKHSQKDTFVDESMLRYDAEKLTKDNVLALLKAPTTAKFSLQTRHDNFRYALVKGTVTSQNSFGAMLTVPVESVCYNDNGKWRLALLNYDGKEISSDKALLDKCRPETQLPAQKPATESGSKGDYGSRPGSRFPVGPPVED
jgi:hypothetical protein